MANATESKRLRRSMRERGPNRDLISRRSILSQLPTSPKKNVLEDRKTAGKHGIHNKRQRKGSKSIDESIGNPTKKQKLSDPLEKADDSNVLSYDIVVTKNAGIICPDDGRIQPMFFPTESENSGIILFNSKRRAILKVSFTKCFVVLNGQFTIDKQGIFKVGDFIKAPAGSQLGIKYLGGNEEGCGRIIFFKSQS